VTFPGGGIDPTRGLDQIPDAVKDMDLKKQVKKPAAPDAAEGIIEGVTHDSIDEFVQSRKYTRHVPEPTGFFARLRSMFGR